MYCDGTFKCTPKPFRQIYSIHGEIDGIVKPLAYALLVDKKKSTYKKLFQLLKTTIPDLHVDIFTSDFEEAAVRGIMSVFPDVTVKGCYFHYRQALKRKSKALELNKNSVFRKHVALCAVLPHLPVEDLEDAWLYIMSECPQDDIVTKFNDYMVNQWINHELWSDKFSTYGEIHKTNNHVESHYSELGKLMNKNKLINLVKLLGYFEKNCNNFSAIHIKMPTSQNQKKAKTRNELINAILQEYKNGQISLGHCLEKLQF